MKISKIDAMILKVPVSSEKELEYRRNSNEYRYLTKDYYVLTDNTGVIYSDNRESVIVKITTDDGVIGYGESLAPTNPEICFELITKVIAPSIIGFDPFDSNQIYDKVYNMYRVRGLSGGFLHDALASVDIALWDIKARFSHVPLFKMLGGRYRDRVPYYLSSVDGITPEEKIESLARYVEKGITAFKMHTLHQGWEKDIDFMRKIRERFNENELKLMYDGHWTCSLGDAVKAGLILDELGVLFYECPLIPEDYLSHRELAHSIRTRIALGESMRTVHEFVPYLDERIVGTVQPDIGRTGITQFMDIANYARYSGASVGPHLSTHQLAALAASIGVSFAIPNLFMVEFQPQSFNAGRKYASFGFCIGDDGFIEWNDGIDGLGIEIDEDSLSQYVVASMQIGVK